MPDPDAIVGLFDDGHFVVAAIVALAATMAAPGHAHLALAAALGLGGLAWSDEVVVPAVAAAVAGSLLRDDGPRIDRPALGPVALTVVAAGALYGCVPDTERARALAGAVVACAIVVASTRGRWRRPQVAAAAAIAGIGLYDGSTRSSAQLAAIGIAVVLVAGRFGAGPRVVARAAIGIAALAVLSRVIGISDDNDWPALAATGVVGTAIAATRALGDDLDEEPAQLLAS